MDSSQGLLVLPFPTIRAFSPLQPEEEQLACDITGSSSSADDTASLDRHSSHGSDVSLPQISSVNRSRDPQYLNGFNSHGVGAEGRESESEPTGSGEMEEEEVLGGHNSYYVLPGPPLLDTPCMSRSCFS